MSYNDINTINTINTGTIKIDQGSTYTVSKDSILSGEYITTGNLYTTTTTTGNSYTTTIDSTSAFPYTYYAPESITITTEQVTKAMLSIENKEKEKKEKKNPYTEQINDLLKRARSFSKKAHLPYFINIKEYVFNKVYEFTLSEATSLNVKIKTICDENDEFNLEFAFLLALVKYLFKGQYTPEGYVQKTTLVQYRKDYIKMVKYGMKLFELQKKEKEWEEEQKELEKERHKKYVEKKKRRDYRKKHEEDLRLTNAIKKAIKED